MDVHPRDAEPLDRAEVRLERARDRAWLALVPHEHLEHRLDRRGREGGSHLVEVRAQVVLDRAGPVASDLDHVEAVLLRELDLVRGRPPVERKEPPDHPDAHG